MNYELMNAGGAATMQKWRLKLDFMNDTVIVDTRAAKLILINLIKTP